MWVKNATKVKANTATNRLPVVGPTNATNRALSCIFDLCQDCSDAPLYSQNQEKGPGWKLMITGNWHWLEYDSVALLMLLIGITLVEFIVWSM